MARDASGVALAAVPQAERHWAEPVSITLDVFSISIASYAPDRLGQHGCCMPAVTDRARHAQKGRSAYRPAHAHIMAFRYTHSLACAECVYQAAKCRGCAWRYQEMPTAHTSVVCAMRS